MNKVLGSSVKSLTLLRLLSGFLSVLLLVGCTTTTTTTKTTTTGSMTNSKVQKKGHKTEADKEKALNNRLQLALGYMGKGDHERARVHLNKAMETNNRSPEVHDVWALLFQREREMEVAESHYKKALSYDPSYTRGRNNYGLFLLRLNRVEEAYQQFVIGSKDLGYPKRAELFYRIGITALKLNKDKEAEEALTKAAVLNPQMFVAYLELADIAYERGDYPRAKRLLNKYNSIKPNTNPRGLWLGVRLERSLGNQDAEASQGMALRNLFPNSKENKEYKNWLKNEQKNQ